MLFEIFIAMFIGMIFGIFTGLIPGIHINLVSLLLLSSSLFLLKFVSPVSLAVFIISMSVIHTFLDAIPSIYLGAPDSGLEMSVLPGHRFLLRGEGDKAVRLTMIGSFFSLIVGIILIPLLIPIVDLYKYIQPFMGWILLVIVFFMIFRDENWIWALFVFLLSGGIGYFLLNGFFKNPLFPLLSGLFGISTLIYSLNDSNKIPKQKIDKNLDISFKITLKAVIISTFAGFLTSIFPGLGSSQGAVLAINFAKNLGEEGFMILMGGINTANFVLSLVTLFILDKARNGSIIVVKELIAMSPWLLLFFCGVILVVSSFAVPLTMISAKIFGLIIDRVSYKKLVFLIISFILFLTFLLSGFMGLIILLTATFLGFIPLLTGCSRAQAMGCLLLPILMFFLL